MIATRVLGVVGAVIAYPFIAASIALSPWFGAYTNALSDLGNIAKNGSVGYLYNAGLVLSGLFVFLFAANLSREYLSRKYIVWTIPLMISSLALASVGIFSEDAGRIHGVLSEVFFIMVIVTMLVYSYASWRLEAPAVGAIALSFGIVSAFIWFAEWPWSGVAIQEASTSALTAIWLLVVSIRVGQPALFQEYDVL